jgi:hypothetical protein
VTKRVNTTKQAAVSHELVCSLLAYDPETGIFSRRNGRGAASQVGYLMPKGYRIIRVNYHKFLAHRLAWFYVHGEWPPHEIDHVNRRRDDNRIANLRPATRLENAQNICTSPRRTRCPEDVFPVWNPALAALDPSIQLSFGG